MTRTKRLQVSGVRSRILDEAGPGFCIKSPAFCMQTRPRILQVGVRGFCLGLAEIRANEAVGFPVRVSAGTRGVHSARAGCGIISV